MTMLVKAKAKTDEKTSSFAAIESLVKHFRSLAGECCLYSENCNSLYVGNVVLRSISTPFYLCTLPELLQFPSCFNRSILVVLVFQRS